MSSTSKLVEHFFRHEYGRLVALLTSQLGVRHLELAEDVVQTSLSKALLAWSRTGIPDQPSAWLYRTAKNLALDSLRRDKVADRISQQVVSQTYEGRFFPDAQQAHFQEEIGDETLRLLFLCCHPALASESRVALALKTVSGFSVSEVANSLLTTTANIEKRLTRAKQRLREQTIEITQLTEADVRARRESVLSTIYLIYSEGFSASHGNLPIRHDLCQEAIRLAEMMAAHPVCAGPSTFALISLLLLHSARLDSRLDSSGAIVLLADQNRSQWNWDAIRTAMAWAERSASGPELSRYHIEAAIAWEHCRAENFCDTNWGQIVLLYSLLLERFATPMIRLNAAVACSYVQGPEMGRSRLLALHDEDRKVLRPWWDCCMAQLYERSGDSRNALSHWRDALALAKACSQRAFIQAQIDRLQ